MDLLDIIFVSAPIVKGLLLLLGTIDEESMNNDMKKIYNDFMKMKGAPEDSGKVDEFISFISDDKFDPKIFQRSQNWGYLAALKDLKEEIVKFYFTELKELSKKDKDFSDVRDVYLKINRYMLQVMRLRTVINPDFKLSLNKHAQTDITYLTIKAYWLNNDGKKERKFAKSVGRLDNYTKGIEDENAIKDGLDLIQPMMWDLYKDVYPN